MNSWSHRRGVVVVATVGLVWLLAGAGDWFMRFHWYRWRQTLIEGPATVMQGPAAPLQHVEAPARKGGDLSNLIGIPSVSADFEEERPASTEWTDEFGYRNVPPTTNIHYTVVTTGSSYMNVGGPMTNIFAARLSKLLGVPVYNHAYPGRGPFFGLIRFLERPDFQREPPRVLVWGIVEREIGGDAFGGMLYQMMHSGQMASPATTSRIRWPALFPKALKQALPDTSALAQAGAMAWNRLRYLCLGRINPEVAVSRREFGGRPFLFYAPAVTALKWTPEERQVGLVVDDIAYLCDTLRARGIELFIVLIPDKEQVYREELPAYLNNPSSPIPPSCLDDIEAGLRKKGVHVANMLPLFRERAAAGEFLYWRDDTHWNNEAVGWATRACAPDIEHLLTQRR